MQLCLNMNSASTCRLQSAFSCVKSAVDYSTRRLSWERCFEGACIWEDDEVKITVLLHHNMFIERHRTVAVT